MARDSKKDSLKRKRVERQDLYVTQIVRLGGTFCFASGLQSEFAVVYINRGRFRECLEGLMNVPPNLRTTTSRNSRA